MVELLTEIPVRGRTFSAPPRDDRGEPVRVALESFVAGPENRVTASAINRLLEAQGAPLCSLLAICGASGTGKTHLARGLVHSWQERFGANAATYLTAADFRHALADAVRHESVGEFRGRLREHRLLVLDDIDRLPRDEYVQQELRFTIDAFAEADAMLVVTSKKPLSVVRELSPDVRSRLAAGLELRLAAPEEAARTELVRHTSAALGRPLSPVAAASFAAGIGGTANELFGALLEFNARFTADGDGRQLAAVDEFLAVRSARKPAMNEILQVVARYYRVSQKVLKSSTRRQSAVVARAMAIYLARELAELSYQRIGQALGGRDHTTVMHNYRKVADALPHDRQTCEALAELLSELQAKTGGVENV
ncbi:MAG: DnaA/Hda family protein [Pirellulales bacterium]